MACARTPTVYAENERPFTTFSRKPETRGDYNSNSYRSRFSTISYRHKTVRKTLWRSTYQRYDKPSNARLVGKKAQQGTCKRRQRTVDQSSLRTVKRRSFPRDTFYMQRNTNGSFLLAIATNCKPRIQQKHGIYEYANRFYSIGTCTLL